MMGILMVMSPCLRDAVKWVRCGSAHLVCEDHPRAAARDDRPELRIAAQVFRAAVHEGGALEGDVVGQVVHEQYARLTRRQRRGVAVLEVGGDEPWREV